MSIRRAILGIGGLGAATVGAWFGVSKSKENNIYRTKMVKFRKTAEKVNEYLKNDQNYHSYSLWDPEHKMWRKRFDYFNSQKWEDNNLSIFPPEVRVSAESMRDFCFQKVEENAGDIKDTNGPNLLGDNGVPKDKKFWEHCLATKENVRQLMRE